MGFRKLTKPMVGYKKVFLARGMDQVVCLITLPSVLAFC